ncbi:copper-containing nitrite reductase [Cyclobacterium jeungdonense]|uniref:Copper-containing nitrite reductase n=1 Tax=Cyclobacterium jeungdonense TaxID=708087 RepID=A0ABT8C7I1_9BACT|nr:copper-containing nitrite reductase [Cyclobacterium jeungdonense]MDN3688729.1 copper-containing nitrite reductase [Cyclobacterium jeungdonense]
MEKVREKVNLRVFYPFILFLIFGLEGCGSEASEKTYRPESVTTNSQMKLFGEEEAILTAPPLVPPPVGNRPAKKLYMEMEIIEKEAEMADGVTYMYWTFGGSVPGSFIRTRVGDLVEFKIKNHPDNKLPHNIDLHAVTGQGGGAEASFVAPGQEKTFSFKVINPGLYVYHCATAPVGMHVANGMYGLILVEPAGGLPPVDKEFYVMQGDFYTEGKYGQTGLQPFSMQKAIDENPDYVVFNGSVNGLSGDNAITAKVGESIRIFFGNGGPNLASSFHVIGEIFDKVYVEGGSQTNTNVQTTLVPAGGSAILEFVADVPSNLVLVDHSIFRAFNKGALGILAVSGEENPAVFAGEIMEGIYQPEGSVIQTMPQSEMELTAPKDLSQEEQIAAGKKLYMQACFACHQTDGQGVPNAFPPLADADYLNADPERAIDVLLNGLSGEITVNGKNYNSIMPAQQLTNEEVANVLTYVYHSWGNIGTVISPEMVKSRRK